MNSSIIDEELLCFSILHLYCVYVFWSEYANGGCTFCDRDA
jgi:hypothetical protein